MENGNVLELLFGIFNGKQTDTGKKQKKKHTPNLMVCFLPVIHNI